MSSLSERLEARATAIQESRGYPSRPFKESTAKLLREAAASLAPMETAEAPSRFPPGTLMDKAARAVRAHPAQSDVKTSVPNLIERLRRHMDHARETHHFKAAYTIEEVIEALSVLSPVPAAVPGVTEAKAEILEKLNAAIARQYRADGSAKSNENSLIAVAYLDARQIVEAALSLPQEPVAGWRSMDSAPKDGTRILIDDSEHGVTIAHYISSSWQWSNRHHPIRWMPLPASSSIQGEG